MVEHLTVFGHVGFFCWANMWNVIPLLWCIVVARGAIETDGLVPLFEAIRSVETGGRAQARDAVGDDGRSIGPYQISRAYWADSSVRGNWKQCKDGTFAETVMRAYWKRYCPEALQRRDSETLARVHNGGPKGHRKAAMLPYWKMIRERLADQPTARTAHATAITPVDAASAPMTARPVGSAGASGKNYRLRTQPIRRIRMLPATATSIGQGEFHA